MQRRSFVVPTAALAVVALFAVCGPVLADGPRTWVMRDSDDDPIDESAGWLGVSVEAAVDDDEGGALVRFVVEDSPAEDAGLRRGDIIVAVDGRTVRGPASLTRRIRDLEGGDRVNLTVMRDGSEMTIDTELLDIGTRIENRVRVQLEGLQLNLEDLSERLEGLGNIELGGLEGLEQLQHLEHLADFQFDISGLENIGEHMGQLGRVWIERCDNGDCRGYTLHGQRPLLGVGLSETTPELRRHLGGDDDSGALVDGVVSGSPADDAGIHVGDLIVAIDGEPVKGAREIRRALEGRDGDRVRVEVIRDGSPLTLDVDLPQRDDDGRESRGPRA